VCSEFSSKLHEHAVDFGLVAGETVQQQHTGHFGAAVGQVQYADDLLAFAIEDNGCFHVGEIVEAGFGVVNAPLPGVNDFIAACRQRGLKLAVASSADMMKVEINLREIGVPATTFDAVLTGGDATHKKPHPEVFLKAAARLNLAPSDCVVVEDAPSGVKAAKSAGSKCLGLTTSFDEPTLRAAGADWIAPHLAKLPSDFRW